MPSEPAEPQVPISCGDSVTTEISPEGQMYAEIFRTEHLQTDLKRRSVHGVIITMTAQAVKFVIALISTMSLARLLTPPEFGVVAMVSPITGFIGLFKDLGLSLATVQRDEINHQQVSTLFWINVAVSLLLGLVTMAISPLIGLFYHDSRTAWIALASGSIFIFGGLTAQHQALLTRQMRFGILAIIDICSIVAGVAAAIVTAWAGWSYWSLVMNSVAAGTVNLLLVWTFSPWRPGKPTRGSGVRSMLKFGSGMTMVTFVGYFNGNLDRVVLAKISGWRFGKEEASRQVGIYNRSLSVFISQLLQVLSPLGNVVIPVFCRLADDSVRLRKAALVTMEMCTALALPLASLCLFATDWVILGLLGPRWQEAIPVTRALSLMAFWFPLGAVVNWMLVAKGQSRVLFVWEVCWSVLLAVVVTLGSLYGATGLAIGLSAGNLIAAPFYLFLGQRYTPLRITDFMKVLGPDLIHIAAAFTCVWLIRTFWAPASPMVGLLASAATIGLVHLALLYRRGILTRAWSLVQNRTV